MTAYHSIVCTEDACDPGVDGGPACPHYRAADEELGGNTRPILDPLRLSAEAV